MKKLVCIGISLIMIIQLFTAALVYAQDSNTKAENAALSSDRVITVDLTLENDTEGVSYKTLTGAVNYVNENKPKSESERITIEIAPGTYREYILLEAPYITMKKKSGADGAVKLTFYYGQCNNYYSFGEFWDKKIELAKASKTMTEEEKTKAINSYNSKRTFTIGEDGSVIPVLNSDGSAKTTGTNNSSSFTVSGKANDFIAEGIIFENSYNIEVAAEEDADMIGAETNAALTSRKKDPTTQQTQSVALCVSGDRAIFRNCEMYGRQDTLYIKDRSRTYFEKCYIEGTVDYIFGDSIAVFNECTLNSPYGTGHVTAANHAEKCTNGYLFLNCSITREAKNGKSKAADNSYTLGRPWRPDANITYVNCKMDKHISKGDSRFTDMSSNSRNNARWQEYNTMDIDGNPILSSVKASYETILNDNDLIIKYNPWNFLRASYNSSTESMNEPDDWDPMGVKELYKPDIVSEAVADSLVMPSGLVTENIALATEVPYNDDIKIKWTSSNENVIDSTGRINLGKYGDEIKSAYLTATISQPGAKDIVRRYNIFVGNDNVETDKVMDFESEEKSVLKLANTDYLKDSEFALGDGKQYLDNITWGITEENSNKSFEVNQKGSTNIAADIHEGKGIHDFKYEFGNRIGEVTEISFDVNVKAIGTKGKVEIYIRPADADNFGSKSVAQVRFEPSKISDGKSTNTFIAQNTIGNKYKAKIIIDASKITEENFDSTDTTLAPKISYYIYDESGKRIVSKENNAPFTAIGSSVTAKNLVPGSITVRPDRNVAGINFTIDNIYVRSLNEISEKDLADVSAKYKGKYIDSIESLPKYGRYGSKLKYDIVSGSVEDGGELILKATAEYDSIAETAAVDEAFNVTLAASRFMAGESELDSVLENSDVSNTSISYLSDKKAESDSAVIMVLYKDGVFERMSVNDVKANDTITAKMDNVTIPKTDKGRYELKVMVWDGLLNISPISACDSWQGE